MICFNYDNCFSLIAFLVELKLLKKVHTEFSWINSCGTRCNWNSKFKFERSRQRTVLGFRSIVRFATKYLHNQTRFGANKAFALCGRWYIVHSVDQMQLKTSGKCGQGAKLQRKRKRKQTHVMHVQLVVQLILGWEFRLHCVSQSGEFCGLKRNNLVASAEKRSKSRGRSKGKGKAKGKWGKAKNPTILLIKNAIRGKKRKMQSAHTAKGKRWACALLYTLDCTAMFD